MEIAIQINEKRITGKRNPMIYGQFIEHFHRQIYDGIYDPSHPLADEDGLRTDILDTMRRIKVPVLRWPGGCFVSSYHWKDAVGPQRKPLFDKAWRVEDPNTFGTDEYIRLCRKVGCEPYICTNAGTGTAEEMSDWCGRRPRCSDMWTLVWSCLRRRFRMWTGISIFLKTVANIWTGCPYMNTGI